MNISTSTVQQRRRKPTANVIDDEDATLLKLGPEFERVQIDHDGNENELMALNLSEARLLINTALKTRKEEQMKKMGLEVNETNFNDNDDDEEEDIANSNNEVLRKTREYLSVFARFRDESTIAAAENLIKVPENANLHPFEIAQLGSLACYEADEAKTLIPSLVEKKSDMELQNLLDNLRRFG
ncbi:hypothetical protein NADFUDRAFT_46115 [Nadsonia fulvescens var. elongata DSM 6958]|uniref:RNA polymerase Rpb4/RPC9 core domain-containing protein n=1 Tax=Nadsonia fulvescens var. elongata DSM 6958 TaxID=857566 RepID=A0A1E3PP84_9ASCO|nr:hypothetical protein NADFUDRAFT_46115 [Nadsonia fulvescens var. elongata DSM 6958]